ncbi:MAG: tRNA guanosine(34) transglycosylase Tgt, partial [Wolbachia endosymbiont of Andrena labialis]|nr:tRNA guanosine(34) transglycosylase Tgt [Wolbachia endosymbiont of Andrena labialis]
YTAKSMLMSHRWAERSLNEFEKNNNGKQALYGISQGGVYQDLRRESCDFINDLPFFGQAIGGSLGQSKEQMHDVVSFTMDHLKKDRPTHLLGIGGIVDIFRGVELGIDTFDCVHPTRLARHGGALVKVKNRNSISSKCKEHINLRNQRFELDNNPIESDCLCFTCRKHSRAYIHHLLKAKELLAYTLVTIHNIFFMNKLMASIRQAILDDRLDREKNNWISETPLHCELYT